MAIPGTCELLWTDYCPEFMRSSLRVVTRARMEHVKISVIKTSAPAQAWRCQSSYGAIA